MARLLNAFLLFFLCHCKLHKEYIFINEKYFAFGLQKREENMKHVNATIEQKSFIIATIFYAYLKEINKLMR